MAARIDQDRPSPEALLEQAKREGRGKLRIFLGAAPGVGKTFEMLTQGRRRRLDGADVVIGVVETHARLETEALTKGFDIVPKKRSLYKGRVFSEMDLDAILQRKPQLVLVDELAHTNVEGSRHPKRYLDVEELLAAGIDVFTTVNIQHIDSLNDVIAQITRIRVRETVPDAVLDEADEIELVDLTAEDLLARLREGKVYIKAQAERALNHFFSPGNLTALRELALRKVAQHVDRDMVDYMQAHAIGGPWPAGERILVCVSERASSAELVRYARRVAAALKAEWTALHIESARHVTLSEVDKDRIADTLRLAQRLGGQAASLPGRDIAESILNYAHRNNITQIIIAKSERPFWFELIYGSVVRDLVRNSGAISVTTVSPRGEVMPAKSVRTAPRPEAIAWRGYLVSAGAVAVTVGVAWLMNALFAQSLGSVGMIFLVPVLVSAVFYGRWPAFVTALLSVMAYNFFFLPPLYTFTIADPNNWLSFAVLLFVAIIAGNLAARVRAQADLAAARAAAMTELFRFTGKLAGIASLDDILWAAAFQISSMLKTNVVILLENAATKSLDVRAGYPPEDELDAQDLAAATWCWGHRQPAGRNAETLPGAKRLFLPMRTGEGIVGVAGLQRPDDRTLFAPDERRLLDALLDQAALAIERSRLVERVDEAQVLAEADKLRVAMLTSLSHDLRTPLASILGAATTLIASRDLYDGKQTDELLATIREEAERLDRFVGNLLDMSRLEAGALGVKLEALDVRDLVDAATKRLARRLSTHKVAIELPADLPLVRADPLLLEQAIFNLLDNAVKYSPMGSVIGIHARTGAGRVILTIEDEGAGISPEALPHIFEKFYRAKASDSRIAGTGLGLAVARGFVEAFGGRLEAANRTDGKGAVLTVSLPIAATIGMEHGDQFAQILIVDDEPQILRFLRASLPPHGYECVEANSGSLAIKSFAKERPDALILDLGLPDQDGFAVIQAIRAAALTPIIVLSARNDVEGKVRALEMGADDYVTKPFDMAELLARLKAALRHGLQAGGEAPIFRTGPLSVDLVNRRVMLGDHEVHLSPKEYGLLRFLVAHAGKVVTHQQLLNEVWGAAHVQDFQYLRVLMRQLRQKIEPGKSDVHLLITEQGVGYRLLAAPETRNNMT